MTIASIILKIWNKIDPVEVPPQKEYIIQERLHIIQACPRHATKLYEIDKGYFVCDDCIREIKTQMILSQQKRNMRYYQYHPGKLFRHHIRMVRLRKNIGNEAEEIMHRDRLPETLEKIETIHGEEFI